MYFDVNGTSISGWIIKMDKQFKKCLVSNLIQSNYSSMSEFQCETNATLAKRSAKRVTAKSNKVSPLDEPEQIQHDITPSSFIIHTSKSIKRRKPLPSTIQFFASYSCGASLKTVTLDDESLNIDRVKRFPNSQFQMCDLADKNEGFSLVSNFLGSRYNLLQKNDVILTISFSTGLCGNCGSRQFSIYSLAANVKYQSLKKEYSGQDLEELYEQPENMNKIQKFVTLEPKRNIDNGDLSLNFARNHVIPAVENAIVVDILGQQTLQIVKLGRGVFEVGFQQNIPKLWAVALGIASLDFKWALQ